MESQRTILPKRSWWVLLAIIMVVAGFFYYPNYDFSLPYIDHPDEPQFVLAAQAVNDLGTAKSLGYHSYPPGIISLNYVLYQFVYDGDGLPHEILKVARLISITAGVVLLIPLALLSYHAFGEFAGLIAPLLWISNPLVLERVRYALPNNYLTLFSLTAILLVFLGTKYNRSGWATLGLFSLMIAIAFKTQAIFLLPLVLFLPLLRLYIQPKNERKQILSNFGLNVIRITVFLIWLLIFYPTLSADEIPNFVAPTSSISIPSLDVLTTHWEVVSGALSPNIPFLIIAVILVIASLWDYLRKEIDVVAVVLLILSAMAWLIGISLFGIQDMRQFYPMLGMLIIFYSGMLAVVVKLIEYAIKRFISTDSPVATRTSLIASGIVFFGIGIMSVSQIQNNVNYVSELSGTDTRVLLANYADISVSPAPHIATWENHKTLNPAWGGIPMDNFFPLFTQAAINDRSLDEWHDQGVEYAVMPLDTWDNIQSDYSNEVTELRRFSSSAEFIGPSMAFIYLYPIQNLLDTEDSLLGNIDLIGYDAQLSNNEASNTLDFRFYWQASAPTDVPYQVFIHLLDENDEIVAQVDAIPLITTERDTTTWSDINEILLSRIFSLTLPDDFNEDDNYRVITGLYRIDTFQRLTNPTTGRDTVTVTTFPLD